MNDIWNSDLATYVFAFILVIALIGVGAWLLKSVMGGGSGGGLLRRNDRRLGVVEAASVDGRRKLVLVRRDSTEHLIMTGGPVDVLIETGIQSPRSLDRVADVGRIDRDKASKGDDVAISRDMGVIERE